MAAGAVRRFRGVKNRLGITGTKGVAKDTKGMRRGAVRSAKEIVGVKTVPCLDDRFVRAAA